MNRKPADILMPAAAILLSLAGIALYLILFLPDFNIYSLILAPVILAFYQIPAVWVFWLWRRRRRLEEDPPTSKDDPPRPAAEKDDE